MLALPQVADAADAPPQGFDPNQAVTVTPAMNTLAVDAGGTLTVDATIKNQTRRGFRFTATTHDSPVRRGGSMSFDFVEAGTRPTGLGAWLTVAPRAFVLQAGTEQRVKVHVRVPAATDPGEYFGGVAFLATPLDAPGAISIRFEVKDIFLLTVGGIPKRDLRVEVHPPARWALRGGRSAWVVTLRNRGRGHEVFAGQLRFSGRFGSAPTARLRSGVLLPGETRSQRITADVRDAPDLIVAKATIRREDGPDVRADSESMVVLPWWFALLVVAGCSLAWWRLRRRARWSSDEDGMPIAGP